MGHSFVSDELQIALDTIMREIIEPQVHFPDSPFYDPLAIITKRGATGIADFYCGIGKGPTWLAMINGKLFIAQTPVERYVVECYFRGKTHTYYVGRNGRWTS